jgi:hypothetical protein
MAVLTKRPELGHLLRLCSEQSRLQGCLLCLVRGRG